MLRSIPGGSSDLVVSLVDAQDAFLRQQAKTISRFEILKSGSISTSALVFARARASRVLPQSQHILAENIFMASIEDIDSNKCDKNAYAGFELAYWSCWLQRDDVFDLGTTKLYSSTATGGIVKVPSCPVMMAEWTQAYILWNLVFGYNSQDRAFLFHVAKLLTPCLLAVTNENPEFFMFLRVLLLQTYSTSVVLRPEQLRMTPTSYEWRSMEMRQFLGELSERVVGKLSTSIAAKLDRSHLRNALRTRFSRARWRVLGQYQHLGEDSTEGAMTVRDDDAPDLGDDWIQRIAEKVRDAAATSSSSGQSVATAIFGVAATTKALIERLDTAESDDELIAIAQELYVERILVATVRDVVGDETLDLPSCLGDVGLTSQDATRLQSQLEIRFHVVVPLELIMSPEKSLEEMARDIYHIAVDKDDVYAMRRTSLLRQSTSLFQRGTSMFRRSSDGRRSSSSNLRRTEWMKVVSCCGLGYVGIGTNKKRSHSSHQQNFIDVVQFLGILVVLFFLSAAVLPAYYYGLFIQWKLKTVRGRRIYVRRDPSFWVRFKMLSTRNDDDVWVPGLLVPLVIPVFMLSLTLIVVLVKWILIGRYEEKKFKVPNSVAFLRWWLMDRIMDQWERFVGNFIKDTLLIAIFYKLMGADVAMTAKIDGFLREFDLVTIGPRAQIKGAFIIARRFAKHRFGLLTLKFGAVRIAEDAVLESGSVVMPGCRVEKGATLDPQSATLPGTRLKSGTRYNGSPAKQTDDEAEEKEDDMVVVEQKSFSFWTYEMAKVLSLPCILYATYFTAVTTSSLLFHVVDFDDVSYRYRELLYWVLSYFWGSGICSVLLCLIAKWTLLGRGTTRTTEMGTWLVEYFWFRIVTNLGSLIWDKNGWVGPVLLTAFGAHVALDATLMKLSAFSAAEADFISIGRHANVSTCVINCQSDGKRRRPIRLGDSTQVGLLARVNAGTTVEDRAIVGHQTIVPEGTTVKSGTALFGFPIPVVFPKNPEIHQKKINRMVWALRPLLLRFVGLGVLAFVALIPSYELAVWAFFRNVNYYRDDDYLSGLTDTGHQWRPPLQREVAILLILPICALLAYTSFIVTFRLFIFVVFWDDIYTDSLDTVGIYLFLGYLHTTMIGPLLAGTRLFCFYMRFWGARVHSTALLFTTDFLDPKFIDLREGCLLDVGVKNRAHTFQYGKLHFGKKTIGANALLHPYACTWANDSVNPGVVLGPRSQLSAANLQPRDLEKDEAPPSLTYPPGTYLQGVPAHPLTDSPFLLRDHHHRDSAAV